MTHWLYDQGSPSRSTTVSYSLTFPLEVAWTSEVSLGVAGSALAYERMLYVTAWGRVYAMDLRNGQHIWEFLPEQSLLDESMTRFLWTPVIWQDCLYIAHAAGLHCVNRHTGELLWKQQALWIRNNSVCVYAEHLFLGTMPGASRVNADLRDNTYACVSLDGELQWFVDTPESLRIGRTVIEDNMLICNGVSGSLYGVDVRDGQVLWCTDTTSLTVQANLDVHVSRSVSVLCIVDHMVITKLSTPSIYAGFDLISGAFKWGYQFETLTRLIGCDHKQIYFDTASQIFSALTLDRGELVWQVDQRHYGFEPSFADPGDKGLVVGDACMVGFPEGGHLAAFHTATGQVLWHFSDAGGSGGFRASPIFVDGKLIIGSIQDMVYCFEAPAPPQNTQAVNEPAHEPQE